MPSTQRSSSSASACRRAESRRPVRRAPSLIASNASATASRRASIGISAPGEAVRIAGAVPALVVVEYVRQAPAGALGDGLRAGRAGNVDVLLICASSLAVSAAGLATARPRGLGDLAEVVERRAEPELRRAAAPRQPSRRARPSAIDGRPAPTCPRGYGSRASSAAERTRAVIPRWPTVPERARFPSSPVGQRRRVRFAVKVGVPRETAPGERRVALVPDAVRGSPAGRGRGRARRGRRRRLPDEAYEDAGAASSSAASWGADAVVKVGRPSADEVAALARGRVLIGFLQPLTDPEGIERLAARGVVAFAMESIPRITRAQSMDALSSQARSPATRRRCSPPSGCRGSSRC